VTKVWLNIFHNFSTKIMTVNARNRVSTMATGANNTAEAIFMIWTAVTCLWQKIGSPSDK